MKKDLTELVFILDKSGSMSGLESDTIGGFNSLLRQQQEVKGRCHITTVLFDHGLELLHDRIDIRAVSPLTDRDYRVGGTTALLDAVGHTVHKISRAQKHTAEAYRVEKVMVVIITDGQENASRSYSPAQVQQLITHQQQKYGWEFVFLGANIDAAGLAAHFGIGADRALDYLADSQGTALNYQAMSQAVRHFRHTGQVDEQSLDRIREDYRERSAR